jgi:hypothetical protein
MCAKSSLKGRCHERNIFLKVLYIHSKLSVYALMVLQGLSKAFTITIINFLFASFEFETLLRIPFSVIDRCSLVPTSHWLQAASSMIFTESQAASCNHFQCQNRSFRVFETGYWKDFQN